jgi:hypothetical protein
MRLVGIAGSAPGDELLEYIGDAFDVEREQYGVAGDFADTGAGG